MSKDNSSLKDPQANLWIRGRPLMSAYVLKRL